ncbi:MAG: dihydroorotase [Clostridiales bacterium]|nr:dihydroorotase [Clostridiales bacterium]
MYVLIKGGRVIDPANKVDEVKNIFIENEKIISENNISENFTRNAEIIDAKNLWVVPGLIDMHVHLRDPGQLHKETIQTGTRAAAAGGFTTVCCMPNTSPVADSKETIKYISETVAKDSAIRVIPIGSITKGLAGEELSMIREMKDAGICAISDDGKTVENPALFTEAMKLAKEFGLPVLAHCEDTRLCGAEAEEIIIARDIILARAIGVHLHICHVSTAYAVELIRDAKKRGQKITAEVTPHHFTLTKNDAPEFDANFKMAPPLRTAADRNAILAALKDGTIDAIATDHAPHHEDEKSDFNSAANGIIGLETAVPLAISQLIETGILSPSEMIKKFTMNPAKILGFNSGHLSVGASADVTIIDTRVTHTINKNAFYSLSRNTPFHGRNVTGRVKYTIANGKVVYHA